MAEITIAANDGRIQYTAAGGETSFDYDFPIFDADHLVVERTETDGTTVTTLTRTTNYTVSGVGEAAGGTVTLVSPASATATEVYTLYRDVPEERTTDFTDAGDFLAADINRELDLITMQMQQLRRDIGRSVVLPQADTISTAELPIAASRASKFLAFDATGALIAAAGTSADLTPVSTFMNGLLDDADAPTARATLVAQEDVITTQGDLVVGDGSGDADRHAIGDDGDFLRSTGTTIAWEKWLPRGHIDGLTLSRSAAQVVGIAAGAACADDGETALTLSSAWTKDISSTFAAGTGNGALDTGAIANSTWYHVFVIGKTDGTEDVLISTSLASPTMPTGYTLKRRIGSILTDGSAQIVDFIQVGDRFIWKVLVLDVNETNPGTAEATATLRVPPDVRMWARWVGHLDLGGAGSSGVRIYPTDVTDAAPSDSAVPLAHMGLVDVGANDAEWSNGEVLTDTSKQVHYRCSASDASTRLLLAVESWVDPRGRDG